MCAPSQSKRHTSAQSAGGGGRAARALEDAGAHVRDDPGVNHAHVAAPSFAGGAQDARIGAGEVEGGAIIFDDVLALDLGYEVFVFDKHRRPEAPQPARKQHFRLRVAPRALALPPVRQAHALVGQNERNGAARGRPAAANALARDRDGENGKRHDVWRMPPAMSEAAKAVGLPALGWQPQCALRPLWHQFCYYVQKSESLHLNFEPQ